jgi:hypothetical protein
MGATRYVRMFATRVLPIRASSSFMGRQQTLGQLPPLATSSNILTHIHNRQILQDAKRREERTSPTVKSLRHVE